MDSTKIVHYKGHRLELVAVNRTWFVTVASLASALGLPPERVHQEAWKHGFKGRPIRRLKVQCGDDIWAKGFVDITTASNVIAVVAARDKSADARARAASLKGLGYLWASEAMRGFE